MTTIGQLVELNGKLAQYIGDRLDSNRPVLITSYRVSTINSDEYDVLGQVPWSPFGGFVGEVKVNGGWGRMRVDTEPWQFREVEAPVKQPRNGKTFTWYWAGYDGWKRTDYPRCQDCRQYHKPVTASHV